jgi:hypothetical protein
VGDNIPSPWGNRIEILLREVGGFLWIQITLPHHRHPRRTVERRGNLASRIPS